MWPLKKVEKRQKSSEIFLQLYHTTAVRERERESE
jgi:hypothetical protein